MNSNICPNNKNKRKGISEFERGYIIGQYHANFTQEQTSKQLGIPISTVGTIRRKYDKDGMDHPANRSGRPTKIGRAEKRAMVKSFREQPKTPITVHLRRFRELDLDVCKNTFAKYMKQLDLKSYSSRFKAGMNEKQKAKRLQWCKERVN